MGQTEMERKALEHLPLETQASLIAVITAGPLHGNEWLERQMERLLHNPEINHCTKAPRKETKPKQSKASTMLTKYQPEEFLFVHF